MSHRKRPLDELVEAVGRPPREIPDVEVVTYVSGDRFSNLVDYRVIVEAWHHAKAGAPRRRYLAEFSEAERETLGRYYAMFRRWHLSEGLPDQVELTMADLPMLVRACNFFAGA